MVTPTEDELRKQARERMRRVRAEERANLARSAADTERVTYTVPEAARRLGVGRNAAYSAVKRGELPAVKIGDRVLIPRVALEAWLAKAGA